MKSIDLTNNRYGTVTVLRFSGKYYPTGDKLWECVCDCGKQIIRPTNNLKRLLSCGCLRRGRTGDHLNKKYGKLLVIKQLAIHSIKYKGGLWECNCECDRTITFGGRNLHRRKSCGCENPASKLRQGLNVRKTFTLTIKAQYTSYKYSARQAGHTPISKDLWMEIVTEPCFYCGEIDIRNKAKMPSYQKKIKNPLTSELIESYSTKINGIDRVDSSKDYIQGNMVSCCFLCNRMKNNFSVSEFLSKIDKIYKNLIHGKINKP